MFTSVQRVLVRATCLSLEALNSSLVRAAAGSRGPQASRHKQAGQGVAGAAAEAGGGHKGTGPGLPGQQAGCRSQILYPRRAPGLRRR